MSNIYHITNNDHLTQAFKKGSYDFCALKSDGFIHASTFEQVIPTANRFFKGASDLIVLELSLNLIKSEVVFESSDMGDEILFPHIYGELNLNAIINKFTLTLDNNGEFNGLKQLS